MVNILIDFIQDDLLIPGAIAAGCLITTDALERKRPFAARAILGFGMICLWMILSYPMQRMQIMNPGLGGVIRYSVLFLLFGQYAALCHRASFCQCLYAVTVSYSLQNLCERLSEIPRNLLTGFPVLWDRLCLFLLICAALMIYRRVANRDARHRTMLNFSEPDQRVMLFMGAGVVAVSVVLDIVIRDQLAASSTTPLLVVCMNLMSALFSFLTIVVCMSHLRQTDSEKRREVAAQLLHSEQQRFEQEKQLHDAINIKCHDIRHQIAALGKGEYASELRKIGKLVNVYDTAPHTKNAALDVVLSGKMLSCNNMGIQLTCLADGRRLGFMEDSDVYALFGNILDNAMEAVIQVKDEEHRMIALNVSANGDLMLIEAQNFFDGTLSFEEGLPVTSKEDKDYHGFGMRSIRLLTEKYDGDLKLEAKNGVFVLSIMLPIPIS